MSDTAVPIYVAGFLALYGSGDAKELELTPEVVEATQPKLPLPINVDHNDNSEVGCVLAIVNDSRGPFFVGLVVCNELEAVLEQAASKTIFERRGPPLSREERLLYLITNYLPSVSLSTHHIGAPETNTSVKFEHVALCAIGRREGTIVTYDVTLDAVLDTFRNLSPTSKERIKRDAAEVELTLVGRTWAPGTDALTRTLLSTAVNNMMVRDRWSLLAERRRQAGISGHVYLQASEKFKIWGAGRDFSSDPSYKKDPPTISCSPGLEHSDQIPASNLDSPINSDLSANDIAMTTNSTTATKGPGEGNYLWVPAAHYSQLIANQSLPPQPPQPTFAPQPISMGWVPPNQLQPAPHTHYGGPMYPNLTMGPSPLETQIAALVGALTNDRKSDIGYPTEPGRISNKRKRYDSDYTSREYDRFDREVPYYPGEAPPKRHPPVHAAVHPAPPPDTLNALVGAVTSLQQELAYLRARPAAVQPQSYNGISREPIVPVIQPTNNITGALTAPAGPSFPSTPIPNLPKTNTELAQNTPPSAPVIIQEPVVAETSTVINASNVSHVDLDSNRDADLFVAHMRGGR
ncbi:capsid maturation protease [Macropodid alphaherpesvirus 2]|uniref:Capsid scaffolding protein n=1 Tax=Macropodid alphaherpesvirus 2 TaxID=83440 RepID=A0AAE7MLK8_9ALPH|nr:capsid maturation protease [Macropodid alphaherpesvirus 2]QOD40209.1 capsid maturation protease [Macropodid alphaherpesvirus 2]